MRTPDFFMKQQPETIKQDFLCSVVRVWAALLELMHQQGLSAAVNPGLRNTALKFGGAGGSKQGSSLITFSSPKQLFA